jgi:SNF2 family DNA or RNA helicase
MSSKQATLYKSVKKEILEELKDTNLSSIPTALTKLLRLQQVVNHPLLIGAEGVSSGKLIALTDLLEDLIDAGEQKVIVFSRFKEMTKILRDVFEMYNPAYIDGGVEAKTRHEEVKRFQTDPSCQLFIGSTLATAEGITLTASSHVIFYDMPWNYATYSQCFSRAHRIGQKDSVTVYNLICKDSIDEHVYKIVQNKKHISETLLDIKLEGTNDSSYDIREFIRGSLAC